MITRFLKKLIFAVVLLYSFNIIAVQFGLIVPINYITIALVTFLDIPAMILLVFSLILIFWIINYRRQEMETDEIITKYFNGEKLSHAYLLKTNDLNKIIKIVKTIFSLKSPNDNINVLIDEGIYPDLKIIEPDGQWIKKEQIINLQSEFKTKSIYNNKRIYIIKNAENLNKSSGNTLLKFLEEPSEDIIALLMTENKNKVLETIVSRCQYIVLDSNKDQDVNDYSEALSICMLLEDKKRLASIDLINKLDNFEDRNEIKKLFQQMLTIYDDCLLNMYEINHNTNLNQDVFDKICKNNTIKSVEAKLNALIFIIDSIDYNLNLKLLVDKLLIMMFGVDWYV